VEAGGGDFSDSYFALLLHWDFRVGAFVLSWRVWWFCTAHVKDPVNGVQLLALDYVEF
jgi:hypothetical protein